MGRFLDAVKDESVVSPLRRGFNKSIWKNKHDTLGDDEIDRNLFDSGLLLLEKANNIRAGLRVTFSGDLKATTKIRAFAALANYNFWAIKQKTIEAMVKLAEGHKATQQDAPVMAHELASVQLQLPIGAEYGPDEIIQSLVDGIQIPLKRVLELDPDLSGNPEFGKLNWGEAMLDLNLGMLYAYVEGLWDDCVWNGYTTEKNGQLVTFSPGDIHWQAIEAISRVRYLSLAREFAVHSLDALLYSHRPPELGAMCAKALKREGKRQEIQLMTVDLGSEAYQWFLVMRSYASEPYYKELLNESQLRLKGASLEQLLTAWTVTSSASNLLLQGVEMADSSKSMNSNVALPNYAPILQVTALTRAVASASACTYAQATAIVDFLTYRGANDQELWAQPLLPVGRDVITPVFAVTNSPNLRRLVDVWLKQLGVDLGLRGHAFEAYIRSAIKNDMETSPLLSRISSCLGTHLNFTPVGEREEEIDLVAIVGDVLIVGEAKCFLEPAEAKEIARHRDKVIDAVAQVRRKSNAIERNRQAFRHRCTEVGLSLPEGFEIQPIVILNNAIHVGSPIDGVPVVDEYILSVFFRGEFVEVALKAKNRSFEPIKKRILYNSAEEGMKVLPQFLANPPQMTPLWNGVTKRWVPIPGVTETDWSGEFLTVSCVPNVDWPQHHEAQYSKSEDQ